MPKQLCFLKEIYYHTPGSQTMHAFNRSLLKAGIPAVCHHPNSYVTNLARHADDRDWGRNYLQIGRACLVAMMWPETARLLPVGCWAEIIPLCFDCWPMDYQKWEQIFRRYRVKTALFTARPSAEYFQEKMPEMASGWMPEAADPEEYDREIPLERRMVDVLELGRRSEQYHRAITEILREKGYRHLYVQEGKRRMFPTREQLMETWRQTKISVCFPKAFTNLERSGGVETITFRYFESMSSNCLIIGHCPQELKELFGYNPVVEADLNDPAGQLLDILNNISSWQSMVEKNYQRTLEVGSWDARVQTMLSFLRQRGYAA